MEEKIKARIEELKAELRNKEIEILMFRAVIGELEQLLIKEENQESGAAG